MSTLKIPSLGTEAHLGDLYNAFEDRIYDTNIFENLSRQCVVSADKRSVVRNALLIKKPSDKFKLLGINKDLQMSLVHTTRRSFKGSGKFLLDEAVDEQYPAIAIYTYHTFQTCRVNLSTKLAHNAMRMQRLENSPTSTHIVIGITYGIASVAHVPIVSIDDETEESVAAMLKQVALNYESAVSAIARLDTLLQTRAEVLTQLKLYTDYKMNVKSLSNFIKFLPINFNDHIAPLELTLLPVESLLHLLSDTRSDIDCRGIVVPSFRPISQTFTASVLSALDDLVLVRNQLVTNKAAELLRVEWLYEQLRTHEMNDRYWIQTLVRDVRMGKNVQEEWLSEIQLRRSFLHGLLQQCNLEAAKRSYAASRNLRYLDSKAALEKFVTREIQGTCCVLFCQWSKAETGDLLAQFEKIAPIYKCDCAFFDLDALCSSTDHRAGVKLYTDGVIVENDVLRLRQLLTINNVVKFDPKVTTKVEDFNKIGTSTIVKLKCPCGDSCGPLRCICYDCLASVEYDLKKHFLCDCGRTRVLSAKIMCGRVDHGPHFKRASKSFIDQLPRRKNLKSFTMIMMGETGAGKSTMINAMLNYAVFESLAVASKHPLRYVIPTKFVIEDRNHRSHTIQHGVSPDEIFVEGQSCTQKTKCYEIAYEGHIVTLIDVPGVGDVRGFMQDRKNFSMILEQIVRHDEIHGVCIVLPPNSSRLTITLNYYISELCARLPVTAVNNIIFCFTKTRQTFYKGGDTIVPLRKLLEELESLRAIRIPFTAVNTFYYDNEAFKYLCAKRNGVEFCDEVESAVDKSFHISLTESKRLIKYLLGLQPFKTDDILSLNEGRQIISSWMARIVQCYISLSESRAKYEKMIDIRNSLQDSMGRSDAEKEKRLAKDQRRGRIFCNNRLCELRQFRVCRNNYRENIFGTAMRIVRGSFHSQCSICSCSVNCHDYWSAEKQASDADREHKRLFDLIETKIGYVNREILEIEEQLKSFEVQRQQMLMRLCIMTNHGIMGYDVIRSLLRRISDLAQSREIDQLALCVEEYIKAVREISVTSARKSDEVIAACPGFESEASACDHGVSVLQDAEFQEASAPQRLDGLIGSIMEKESELLRLQQNVKSLKELKQELDSNKRRKKFKPLLVCLNRECKRPQLLQVCHSQCRYSDETLTNDSCKFDKQPLEQSCVFEEYGKFKACIVCGCSLWRHHFECTESLRSDDKDEFELKQTKVRLDAHIAETTKEANKFEKLQFDCKQTLKALAIIYMYLKSRCLNKETDELLLFLNRAIAEENNHRIGLKQNCEQKNSLRECIDDYENFKQDIGDDISIEQFEKAKRMCQETAMEKGGWRGVVELPS
ncbi:unnamed protein product [Toxocara canis]|uniref:G domain-containing protein n=1 Tax=Toxocara canis TaxID=6265 RepID=A0A183UA35_TOXCA|nr:unnamed protein product [Toxocara canis]